MTYQYDVNLYRRHRLLKSAGIGFLVLTIGLLAAFTRGKKAEISVFKSTVDVAGIIRTVFPRPSNHLAINQNSSSAVLASTSPVSNHILRQGNCQTLTPPHTNLNKSNYPEIRKISDYELLCNSAVVDRSMIFVGMPKDVNDATSTADDVVTQLKEYDQFGIKPLVIFEPVTSSANLSFIDYQNGKYDPVLEKLFSSIKAKSISDKMLGEWVILPEANTPSWGSYISPDTFAACVSRTAQIQKKFFPGSLTSVMFDSKTYPDSSWDHGAYSSLVDYVKNIPKNLIDSLGYQGFAWPDNTPDYNAGHFLNPSLASEAATALGAKNIWFNTGTFARAKNSNQAGFSLTGSQRQTILDDIAVQAKSLQSKGFDLSVNIFAENKYADSEGIDWSYWQAGQPKTGDWAVMASFIADLNQAKINFWLFDN